MTDLRQAAERAMRLLSEDLDHPAFEPEVRECAAALRAALEAQPDTDCHLQGICQRSGYSIGQVQVQQEPVAWIEHDWSGSGQRRLSFERREPTVRDDVVRPVWTPLYTPPPARKPLTDEQIDALVLDEEGLPTSHLEFARAIERAHGITGGSE